MIRLKIITNRKLCINSLDDTLEKVLKAYTYNLNDINRQEFNSLPNTLKQNSEIESYLKDFQIESIVLREKDISEKDYEKLYVSIKNISSKYNIAIFSHSNWKSKVIEEGGLIHLPLYILEEINSDKNSRERFFEKYREIGVSIHSVKEGIYAEKIGATYLTFGHVFETECKKGLKARGLMALRDVCKSVSIPVYAIGGINNKNAQMAIDCGAYGVCIMSGIMRLQTETIIK